MSTDPSGEYTIFTQGGLRLIERLNEVLLEYIPDNDKRNEVFDKLRATLFEEQPSNANREVKLKELHTILKNCRACTTVIEDPKMPRWNLVNPSAVVVTELPLRNEDKFDQLLVQLLKAAGFSSKNIAATSIVRCFPNDVNRRPSEDEIAACTKRFLFKEIQLLRPKLIITFGSKASSALLGDEIKIGQERGKVFWAGPWPILLTLSTSYLAHNKDARKLLQSDLKHAYNFIYGESENHE